MNGVFPRANTIVSIEESKLLKRFEYGLLFGAKGLDGALGVLNRMNYFRTYETAAAPNFGEMLDDLIKDSFGLMYDVLPEKKVWKLFGLYYDIHNLKLAAKERFLKKRLDGLYLDYGGYSMRTIRSAAVRESDDILGDTALTEGFFTALRATDMHDIDFILDKTYFAALKSAAERLGVPEIKIFVTERADLYNISVYFHSRAAGNPEGYFEKAFSDRGSFPLAEWQKYIGGEPENARSFPLWQKYEPLWKNAESGRRLFVEYDVMRDNYLVERTKAAKLIAFGVLPICAYFFNRLIEIKNVRILLTGKQNDYAEDEIAKRMRIPYEL